MQSCHVCHQQIACNEEESIYGDRLAGLLISANDHSAELPRSAFHRHHQRAGLIKRCSPCTVAPVRAGAFYCYADHKEKDLNSTYALNYYFYSDTIVSSPTMNLT